MGEGLLKGTFVVSGLELVESSPAKGLVRMKTRRDELSLYNSPIRMRLVAYFDVRHSAIYQFKHNQREKEGTIDAGLNSPQISTTMRRTDTIFVRGRVRRRVDRDLIRIIYATSLYRSTVYSAKKKPWVKKKGLFENLRLIVISYRSPKR